MKVKRTERGWPGHFICAKDCIFRRNTLLEYEDKKWIVSTVGQMLSPLTKEIDTIGANRWYETMVFEAKLQHGYWDIDVEKQIYPEQDWGIWGETWEEVIEKYPLVDNNANDMHEQIVNEMIEKIQDENFKIDSEI